MISSPRCYNVTPCEVFTPVLADGLSLESELLQISLGLQDSSQYSGLYHLCCSLDGLRLSFHFKVLQSL